MEEGRGKNRGAGAGGIEAQGGVERCGVKKLEGQGERRGLHEKCMGGKQHRRRCVCSGGGWRSAGEYRMYSVKKRRVSKVQIQYGNATGNKAGKGVSKRLQRDIEMQRRGLRRESIDRKYLKPCPH